MTCLISGGCGFIGLNLVEHLLASGYRRFRILDNLSIGKIANLETVLGGQGRIAREQASAGAAVYTINGAADGLTQCVEVVVGDICNLEACLAATQGVTSVVHLAAHTGVVPSVRDPFHDAQINVFGTLNLLHASVVNGVRRFVFASSGAPLGEQQPPLREDQVPRPLAPYGASKLAGEGYCSAFAGSYGLETVVLRFSNVYGPYSLHKTSVVMRFMHDALRTRRLTIYGDGQQTRDFIYVRDLCEAVRLALACPRSEGKPLCQIFHIGSACETTVLEVAEHIRRLFGSDVQITFESARRGEITRNYTNIERARTCLGFKPMVDLPEGLECVYRWFMDQADAHLVLPGGAPIRRIADYG